jgi:hypothetical protein
MRDYYLSRRRTQPTPKKERRCRECGCTETAACIDPDTLLPCYWVERDLCSVCAKPRVQLFSEAEASAILRELAHADS